MKTATALVAILLSLPFIECLCTTESSIGNNCNHCEDTNGLPNTTHDCLEIVQFFVFSEVSFQFFSPEERPRCLFSPQRFNFVEHLFNSSAANPWPYNLKSHLALKIIQV